MSKTTAAPAQPPQDPTEGGSYRRNEDGSLTLLPNTQTQPATGRRAQTAAAPAADSQPNTDNQE